MNKINVYIISLVLMVSACSRPQHTTKHNPFTTEICLLPEPTRRYYLSRGAVPANLRGMGTRLLTLIQTYGVVPFDSYHAQDPVNYNVVARKLQLCTRSTTDFSGLNDRMNRVLDAAIGYLPGPKVHMLGAEYTPLEFAHSVCRNDEYQAVTSFR